MEIREGIYSYDVHPVEAPEPLGVHVVEAERNILFGSGYSSNVDELSEIIEKHDVDVIIVEHGDADHYDGVNAVRERDDLDVEIAIPRGDAGILEAEGIKPDILLDRDEVYWGIQTISVPGHTPDNMSFLYGDVLIAGDTVVARDSDFRENRETQSRLAVVTPEFSDDDQENRRSIKKLLDYDFEVVLVTHGSNVLRNGYREVEKLVEELDV